MEQITMIRGMEPDIENGGELVEGTIIGPHIATCRWKIGDEKKLYYSRSEVDTETRRREYSAEIFEALGLDQVRSPITTSELVRLIRQNSKALKGILNKQRFSKLLK